MIRIAAAALLCLAAIVTGDVMFRTSLLQQVRPVVLAPLEQAVLAPPVQVEWDGPTPMQVLLTISGGSQHDLGLRTSPLTLEREEFPRDGGYVIELRAPRFGSWIQATRRFQVHALPTSTTVAPPPPSREPHEQSFEAKDLLRALEAARTARDKAHARAKFLSEENSALRNESERLAKQLESVYETQEQDGNRTTELERRLGQLADEQRALADENTALRMRLSAVIPCTVWGYFSYVKPNTVPVTRRFLLASDARGQIFRTQTDCEVIRRTDTSSASVCFCVGNSWGG